MKTHTQERDAPRMTRSSTETQGKRRMRGAVCTRPLRPCAPAPLRPCAPLSARLAGVVAAGGVDGRLPERDGAGDVGREERVRAERVERGGGRAVARGSKRGAERAGPRGRPQAEHAHGAGRGRHGRDARVVRVPHRAARAVRLDAPGARVRGRRARR